MEKAPGNSRQVLSQKGLRYLIPNLFTLLNLFSGCLAIVFALQTDNIRIYLDDQFSSSFNIPEKISWAAICILIAALIDFLDGFIARWLKATSEMGKQLDSLSDVVSFGVAPAVILYQLLKLSFAREAGGLEASMLWLLPAFILPIAAAYRLARFNLDRGQQFSFRGVPVPAVGILVASFPLILHFSEMATINSILISKWFLYGTILLLSYLMVSRLPMMSLKFSKPGLRNNVSKVILLLVALIAALLLHWAAVPIVFIIYILLSLIPFKNKAE